MTQHEIQAETKRQQVDHREHLYRETLRAEDTHPCGVFQNEEWLERYVKVSVKLGTGAPKRGVPKPHGLATQLDVHNNGQSEQAAQQYR